MAKRKFTTLSQAARLCAKGGFDGFDSLQLVHKMRKQTGWTLQDTANLSRIADALERIAKAFGK